MQLLVYYEWQIRSTLGQRLSLCQAAARVVRLGERELWIERQRLLQQILAARRIARSHRDEGGMV